MRSESKWGKEREERLLVMVLLFLNESLINIPSVPSTSIITVGSLKKKMSCYYCGID